MSLLVDIHTHQPPPAGVCGLQSYQIGSMVHPPTLLYSTGIHPWQVDQIMDPEAWVASLRRSIGPGCGAIGEIGLDGVSATTAESRLEQEHWFRLQIGIALEYRLPAVVHCVKAADQLLKVIGDYPSIQFIFHGFTGSMQWAQELLKRGFYLSFGASLLDSPKTRRALAITPSNRLFLESDTGKVPLQELYCIAAQIRQCDPEELQDAVYANFQRLIHPL